MAVLLLGLAGAAVGSTFGMTALGWTIGSSLGGMLFPKKGQDQEGPRLTDTTVQSSSYGADITQLFGTVRTAGNVIWSTNKVETVHKQDVSGSGGGKGPSHGGATQTTYTYSVSMAVAIGDGQIGGVRNIWANGKLIYSVGSTTTTQVPGPNGELVTETVYNATLAEVQTDNAAQTGMTFYLGTETQMPDAFIAANNGGKPVSGYRGTSYIVFQNFQLEQYGNMVPNFEFEVIAQETATTGSIVKHFCNKAGLLDSELDLTALTQPVLGYKIANRGPARQAIEPLANIFFFDAVQSNAVLKFVKRGNPTLAATILENDLDVRGEKDEPGDQLKPTRKSEEELPQEVGIVFINKNNNYQNGAHYARRQVTSSKMQLKVDVPIVMLDSDAKGICETLLHAAWVARTGFVFRTGREYAAVEPTDVVAVAKGGSLYTIRITQRDDNKNGVIEYTGEFEDTGQWQYTPNNALDNLNAPTSFIQDPGNVNTPIILGAPSNLTTTGFELWIGASSDEPEWGGCDVWISTDDLFFTPIGRITAPAIQGVTTATFPFHVDPDAANTLSLDLSQSLGELVTVSQDQLDRFESLAYLDGELISYKTSTPTSAYHFNLTNFHRGVYNTPISAHGIGSPFLFLDGAILRYAYKSVLLGETVYFRFTSFNRHKLEEQDVASVSSYVYVIGGAVGHPDNVSALTATKLADGRISIGVVPIADVHIKRYEIREGGASWDLATPVGVITYPDDELIIPARAIGTYTFRAKAINDVGQYSLLDVTAVLVVAAPVSPTSLTATVDKLFLVELNWVYAGGQTDRSSVEIWAANINDRTTASQLTRQLPDTTKWVHNGIQAGQTWYYWIRVFDNALNPSAFFPLSTTAGVYGQATEDASVLIDFIFDQISLADLDPTLGEAIDLQTTIIEQVLLDVDRTRTQSVQHGTSIAALQHTVDEVAEDQFASVIERTVIAAQVASNTASIIVTNTAIAAGDAANASAISLVSARLDTGDYAAVKTESSATASVVGGMLAKYLVKVDVNGHVAGVELISNGAVSSFIALADQFLFVKPDGTGTPKQIMVLGTINGVSTLGLDGNLVIDGSIVANRIDTRSLSIKDAGGTIIFSAGVPLTGTYIANATIGSAKLTGLIQSSTYVAGSAGWAIDMAGSAEFNVGTFRGSLAAATGTFGGIVIAAGGYVRMGQTAYATGTGFYIGDNSGTPVISVGNATDYWRWNGTSVDASGNIEDKRAYAAGSNRLVTAYQTRSSGIVAATKLKEIQVARNGVITVGFTLASNSATGSTGQIYVNGAAVGTVRTATTGTGPLSWTENISVTKGDRVQLYVANAAATTGFVSDFFTAANITLSDSIVID